MHLHDLPRDVLRIILSLTLISWPHSTSKNGLLSLPLVCRLWNDVLKHDSLWWKIFEYLESQLQGLMAGRYRMRPSVFSNLTHLQRFACAFPISHPAEEFTGYGCTCTLEEYGQVYREGWFESGALRVGISYVIGVHIEEGEFDVHGCFVYGQFDVWKPGEGQWVRFFGRVCPHDDYRDEGIAIWEDGSTYKGQFHYCDLDGFGTFKDQHGVTIASGLWHQNNLVNRVCRGM